MYPTCHYQDVRRNVSTATLVHEMREALAMATKRELIEPHKGDKRYVRRDDKGQFTDDQVDVGRSLSADNNQRSKKIAPKGQGDRGDHKR